MSLATHAERLEARLNKIKNDEKSATERVIHVAEFVGGVGASSAYRAWLNKNNKEMPKIMGMDIDVTVGAALVVGGFLEIIPPAYSEHALNFGAGLVAGTIGNKIAGMVNPAIATKGESAPYQMGAAPSNVSAHRGAEVMEMIRAHRHASLPVSHVAPQRCKTSPSTEASGR